MHRFNAIVTSARSCAQRTLIAFGVLAGGALASTTLAAGDLATIRPIAPGKSFLLLSADDVRGTVERFRKTPLHALWESDTVQKAIAEDWKEFQDDLNKRLQELGLPEDTLSWPVNAGAAAYLERNEELDSLEMAFVGIADWGDGADKMSAFFDASVAEIAKESPELVTTKEVRGRKATILELPNEDDEPAGGMGEDDPMADLGKVDRLIWVRDGSRFVFASTLDGLEDALTAIDVPQKKLVTEEEDARDALAQLGDGDVTVLLRTGPLQPMVQETGGGMMAVGAPLLTQLFGDVQAYGGSLVFDGPVGQIDAKVTVFTPGGRKGLLSLFSPVAIAPAPAIMPSDAIGYGRMNLAFGEIMKIVESTVAGLPEMYAEEVDPMLQAYGPTLTKAFAALGPDIHVVTTVTQPITEESQTNTISIACSDEQAVLPLINLFAPMIGMQSRDFVGQTIFSGEGIPVAIGFGGGFMTLGQTATVEQALRSTSQGGTAQAQPAVEKSAMALLPSRPLVGWGWFDTVAGFEVTRQMLLAADGTSETVDFVDEQGKVVSEVVGVELPTKLIDTLRKMDTEFVSQFVGPQLWDFAADNRGLAYRVSLLRPTKPDPK